MDETDVILMALSRLIELYGEMAERLKKLENKLAMLRTDIEYVTNND